MCVCVCVCCVYVLCMCACMRMCVHAVVCQSGGGVSQDGSADVFY